MKTVACLCCQSTASFECDPGSNVGEISRKSGYEPLLMKDTSVRWICPTCAEEAAVHVRALVLKQLTITW